MGSAQSSTSSKEAFYTLVGTACRKLPLKKLSYPTGGPRLANLPFGKSLSSGFSKLSRMTSKRHNHRDRPPSKAQPSSDHERHVEADTGDEDTGDASKLSYVIPLRSLKDDIPSFFGDGVCTYSTASTVDTVTVPEDTADGSIQLPASPPRIAATISMIPPDTDSYHHRINIATATTAAPTAAAVLQARRGSHRQRRTIAVHPGEQRRHSRTTYRWPHTEGDTAAVDSETCISRPPQRVKQPLSTTSCTCLPAIRIFSPRGGEVLPLEAVDGTYPSPTSMDNFYEASTSTQWIPLEAPQPSHRGLQAANNRHKSRRRCSLP